MDSPYKVTLGAPPIACKMQGAVCPPARLSVKVPSAAVVPTMGEPVTHLAVTEALARAAPVAASPFKVSTGAEPELDPPQPAITRQATLMEARAKPFWRDDEITGMDTPEMLLDNWSTNESPT